MNWIIQRKYFLLSLVLIPGLLGFFALTLKAHWVMDNISVQGKTSGKESFELFDKKGEILTKLSLPKKEPNRLNILLVGLPGLDIVEEGRTGNDPDNLLTDSIVLFSVDKATGKSALISIPRDLSISLPYEKKKRKINEVYAVGYYIGGENVAFGLTKAFLSQVSGVYIDWMVRIDFEGFKKLVDAVGGIDIYLDKPFIEITQWKGIGGFRLPAGTNHLNGNKALFYVRSRFSTTDFDRARRQQQMMLLIKDKLVSLGVLSNPIKLYNVLDIIGNHVKTDADIDIPQGVALINKIDYPALSYLVFDTDNYLYASRAADGAYILLPRGDTFDKIHNVIQNILKSPPPALTE